MNIIEASQSTKKVVGSAVERVGDKYWFISERGIFVNQDWNAVLISKFAFLATDYEFYEEVITPKEAKEVWKSPKQVYFTIKHPIDGFRFVSQSGVFSEFAEFTCYPIHGQGGWTREVPPVQDNDIERVEIKFVGCNDETGSTLIKKDGTMINHWGDKGRLFFEYKKEGEG